MLQILCQLNVCLKINFLTETKVNTTSFAFLSIIFFCVVILCVLFLLSKRSVKILEMNFYLFSHSISFKLDDLEDVEMLQLLLEGPSPLHCISVSTQIPPGFPLEQTVSNLQMFTKVWRSKVPPNLSRTLFSSYFDALFQVFSILVILLLNYFFFIQILPRFFDISI